LTVTILCGPGIRAYLRILMEHNLSLAASGGIREIETSLDKHFVSDTSVLTEIQAMTDHSPVQQKFILHWGEMGTRWGINRTVAQIHALLYLSPKPLPADDIVETLAVARSNVST